MCRLLAPRDRSEVPRSFHSRTFPRRVDHTGQTPRALDPVIKCLVANGVLLVFVFFGRCRFRALRKKATPKHSKSTVSFFPASGVGGVNPQLHGSPPCNHVVMLSLCAALVYVLLHCRCPVCGGWERIKGLRGVLVVSWSRRGGSVGYVAASGPSPFAAKRSAMKPSDLVADVEPRPRPVSFAGAAFSSCAILASSIMI